MPDTFIEPISPPSETLIKGSLLIPGKLHPTLLATTSAVGLWFSFAPAEWNWLVWFALVPVFCLVTSSQSKARLYLGAWVGGFVYWLLSLQWIRAIDPAAWAGWLAMAFVLSFAWPLFLWLARQGVALGIAPFFAAPVTWVGLEFFRSFLLGGFPWYYLAHTQYNLLPMIQVADFAGSLGLSLLIAFVNALVRDLYGRESLRTREVAIRSGAVCLALLLTLGYGFVRINTANFRPGPRIALLQSNLLQKMKSGQSPEEILGIFRGLMDQAMKEDVRPELFVWPETAYPYSLIDIDPSLTTTQITQAFRLAKKHESDEWAKFRAILTDHLQTMSSAYGVPMLIGAPADRFDHRGVSRANSAVIVQPDPKEPLRTYQKIQLVPFGEYIPLIELFPFLTALTPYPAGGIPNLTPGQGPAWYDIGLYRYSPLICFEDTMPHLVRRCFRDAPGGRHPDVLVNLTNDGWFLNTSEQQIHLAVSVFRAVENRVPLARAVNTGISAMIDGNGSIIGRLPADKSAQLSIIAPLDDRQALYPWVGDWVGGGCFIACLAIGLAGLWRIRRPRRTLDR